MRYLLFFSPALALAAKAYAEPMRHRRHHVFLRELELAANSDHETADGGIAMVDDPTEAEQAAIDKLADRYEDFRVVAPGDALPEPTELEQSAMNPLNKLRHDAALLGIEVDPTYTAEKLAELIADACRKLADKVEEDAAREAELTAQADAAEQARKEGEPGDDTPGDEGKAPADDVSAHAGADASSGQGAAADAPPPPAVDPIADIETDVDALRTFAKVHGIQVNPNPRAKASTIAKAIRVALGAE